MKVTIEDRIFIFSLLPQTADYETLKEVVEFEDKLKFTEEEVRLFDIESKEIVDPNGNKRQQIQFNKQATEADGGWIIDIKVPPRVSSHIASTLREMSKNKKLTRQLMSIYKKFVG